MKERAKGPSGSSRPAHPLLLLLLRVAGTKLQCASSTANCSSCFLSRAILSTAAAAAAACKQIQCVWTSNTKPASCAALKPWIKSHDKQLGGSRARCSSRAAAGTARPWSPPAPHLSKYSWRCRKLRGISPDACRAAVRGTDTHNTGHAGASTLPTPQRPDVQRIRELESSRQHEWACCVCLLMSEGSCQGAVVS